MQYNFWLLWLVWAGVGSLAGDPAAGETPVTIDPIFHTETLGGYVVADARSDLVDTSMSKKSVSYVEEDAAAETPAASGSFENLSLEQSTETTDMVKATAAAGRDETFATAVAIASAIADITAGNVDVGAEDLQPVASAVTEDSVSHTGTGALEVVPEMNDTSDAPADKAATSPVDDEVDAAPAVAPPASAPIVAAPVVVVIDAPVAAASVTAPAPAPAPAPVPAPPPAAASRDERRFNFASHAAGAVVLDKSASAKGFHNLLDDDKDKYGISPCVEEKWVVVGLSEDIVVSQVVLANYEKYSSMLNEYRIRASTVYPTEQWQDLGTFSAAPKLGEQIFDMSGLGSSHTRYLRFDFLSHYDNDALCTLSQIKVHGTTVIASFQQEVERSEDGVRSMLHKLNRKDSSESIQDGDDKESSGGKERLTLSESAAQLLSSVLAEEAAELQQLAEMEQAAAQALQAAADAEAEEQGQLLTSESDTAFAAAAAAAASAADAAYASVAAVAAAGLENETQLTTGLENETQLTTEIKASTTEPPVAPVAAGTAEVSSSNPVAATTLEGNSTDSAAAADAGAVGKTAHPAEVQAKATGGIEPEVVPSLLAVPADALPANDNGDWSAIAPGITVGAGTPDSPLPSGDSTVHRDADSAAVPVVEVAVTADAGTESIVTITAAGNSSLQSADVAGNAGVSLAAVFDFDAAVTANVHAIAPSPATADAVSAAASLASVSAAPKAPVIVEPEEGRTGVESDTKISVTPTETEPSTASAAEVADAVESSTQESADKGKVEGVELDVEEEGARAGARVDAFPPLPLPPAATAATSAGTMVAVSDVDDAVKAAAAAPIPTAEAAAVDSSAEQTASADGFAESGDEPPAIVVDAAAAAAAVAPSEGSDIPAASTSTEPVPVSATATVAAATILKLDVVQAGSIANASPTVTAKPAPVEPLPVNATAHVSTASGDLATGVGVGAAGEVTPAPAPTPLFSLSYADAAAAAQVPMISKAELLKQMNTTTAAATALSSPTVNAPPRFNSTQVVGHATASATSTVTCLELLRFPNFQARMMAKLKNADYADDHTDHAPPRGINTQDNVFKVLMDKIKTLETSQAILELYTSQITDCYRTILTEHDKLLKIGGAHPLPLNGSAAAAGAAGKTTPVVINVKPVAPLVPPASTSVGASTAAPVAQNAVSAVDKPASIGAPKPAEASQSQVQGQAQRPPQSQAPGVGLVPAQARSGDDPAADTVVPDAPGVTVTVLGGYSEEELIIFMYASWLAAACSLLLSAGLAVYFCLFRPK